MDSPPASADATVALMRDLDHDYRSATGLSRPGQYKIFYSRIDRFPLLVLGQNPGGSEDGPNLAASATFFENWEHDFPCFRNDPRYSLARPMCDLLTTALVTKSVDVIRQVPMSNLIFRRSPDTSSLQMSLEQAAIEAKPFVARIIAAVKPEAVLLVSASAYRLFKKLHCRRGTVSEDAADKVFTPNGRTPACIHQRATAFVESAGRSLPLFMVGHPSKYGSRAEWHRATSALTKGIAATGISLSSHQRALPRLQGYAV